MDNYFTSCEKAAFSLKKRIQDFLTQRGWTLRFLAAQTDIPYDTLKKLATARIDNPSLATLLKLSEVFECSLDSLVGRESGVAEKLAVLPKHAVNLVESMIELELSLALKQEADAYEYIPLLMPTGNMKDGMTIDSATIETLNIAPYKSFYGDKLTCGLYLNSNALYPVYPAGDVLLLARDRQPLFGENGVFIHHGRLYIRTLKAGNPPKLMPVNGIGSAIPLANEEEWVVFGYILSLYRGVVA